MWQPYCKFEKSQYLRNGTTNFDDFCKMMSVGLQDTACQ